jgi:voltage-gated potassium channel
MSKVTDGLISCANRTPLAIALYLTTVMLSATGVWALEGWGFGDSVWWAFVTTTTTGYGDLFPVTVAGRVIGVLTMFAGIIGIGVIVGRIAAVVIRTHDDFTHEEQVDLLEESDEQLRLLREIRAELGTRRPDAPV